MVKESKLHRAGRRFQPLYPNDSLIPDCDNGRDIGSSTREYKDLYIDGSAYIDTLAGYGIAQLGGTTVSGNIVPQRDDVWDLGTSSAQFQDLYLDGVGYLDDVRVEENFRLPRTEPLVSGLGQFYVTGSNPPILFVYTSGVTAHIWASKTMGTG